MKKALWGLVFLGAYQLGVVMYRKAGLKDLELFANRGNK